MDEFSIFGRSLPLSVAVLLIVSPIGGLEAGLHTGQAGLSLAAPAEAPTGDIPTENQQLWADGRGKSASSDQGGVSEAGEPRDEAVKVTAIDIPRRSTRSLNAETVASPADNLLVLSPASSAERAFALYFAPQNEAEVELELLIETPGIVTTRTRDGVAIRQITETRYAVTLSATSPAPEIRTEPIPPTQSMLYRTEMPVADLTLDNQITETDLRFHTSDRSDGVTEVLDRQQRPDGTVRLRFDGFPTETETNTVSYVTREPDLVVIVDSSTTGDPAISLGTDANAGTDILARPAVIGGEQR
jgi:hypothetical protein